MDRFRAFVGEHLLWIAMVLAFTAVSGLFYAYLLAQIHRTAEWIKKIRLGQNPTLVLRRNEKGRFLGLLKREIAQLARSLVIARSAAQEEARLRQRLESVWTSERLKQFVRTKLEGRPIFVVSNREPYRHVQRDKKIECVVPASGLVTALEPILKACDGTWIAYGDGDADRQTVDVHDRLRVPPEEPQYTLRRLWLTPEEEKGYYYGFSNEGLWPLCHIAHTRPVFRVSDWEHYRAVNQKFATALLREIEGQETP